MCFVLAQVAFVLWAIGFAHFQVPCIKAMRDFVPIDNAYAAPFHKRGLLLSCFIAVCIALDLYAYTGKTGQCLLLLPAFIGIYKIFFDGLIGTAVYYNFFYLGETAKQDIWLNKHFPPAKAGKIKIIAGVGIIAVANLVGYFF